MQLLFQRLQPSLELPRLLPELDGLFGHAVFELSFAGRHLSAELHVALGEQILCLLVLNGLLSRAPLEVLRGVARLGETLF